MIIQAVNLIHKLNDSILMKLRDNISPEKVSQIKRFIHKKDAERALFAEILTRVLLCQKLSIRNRDIVFLKNDFGKPFIQNRNNVHFNVSHTEDWVVCALNEVEIGIDIEKVKQVDFEIADRFFSKDEGESLNMFHGNEKLRYFYDLWTLKESYIKAIGKGLSIPLDSFTINKENGQITLKSEKDFGQFHFKQYNIDDEYKMAVCSRNAIFPQKVTIRGIDEVIEDFLSTL